MKKISVNKLNDLFSKIAEAKALYMPIEKAGQVEFHKWDAEANVRLDALNTVKSAKDSFFPQSEDLMSFKLKGKTIDIIPETEVAEPSVYFGVRACDIKGFEILDKVFLSEPVDTYYAKKRESCVIISAACGNPAESCFCKAFGINASEPNGDVATWMTAETLYWKPLTEKGEELTKAVADLLEDAKDSDIDAFVADSKKKIDALPYSNISLEAFKPEKLNELFKSEKWAELSKACLGCGTCTFVCPTCQCYDIRDFNTGDGIQRYRCWDSCMYSDFTRMAHGNPRKTQLERFRQRFMHKLVYFPSNNNGEYSCVGCGRCVRKCPINMNIIKVIKTLGGDNK